MALALLFGFTLLGSTAQAQLLEATGSVNGSAGAGTGTGADASVDADASVRTDASAANEDTAQNDGADGSVTGNAAATSVADFSILRRSLSAQADTAVGATASDVTDAAGLRAYAEASLRADERFDGITINKDGMSLTYRKDARLLGILPSGMNVTVTVTSAGDVMVTYPWYAFLYATSEKRGDLESRIEAEIANLRGSGSAEAMASATGADASFAGGAGADATFDSQRWARIIDRIQTTLSAEAEGTGSASAS